MHEYPEGVNPETGLIEDITEIRKMALGLANQVILLINHPLLSLLIPSGVKLDLAMMAVTARSLLRHTSQAGYYRELGEAIGMSPREVERAIVTYGLSEVLPVTHPDAPKIKLAQRLNPRDPLIRSSQVLAKVAEMQQAGEGKTGEEGKKKEEAIELSPGIEDFLSDLFKKEE